MFQRLFVALFITFLSQNVSFYSQRYLFAQNIASKLDIASMSKQDSASITRQKRNRILPDKLIVGYANWNQCDQQLVRAVEQGVNVLIWFAINLAVDSEGKPTITNGPDLTCVRDIIAQIKAKNLHTVHLISIGGWNSPHPDTTNTVEKVYENWVKWNNDTFDGFDWDIEGNDDITSPYNTFTQPCLDLMGRMSQLAKKDGFIVAMAPAESYLDPTTPAFDLSLSHNYPEWTITHPTFLYHGHNVYAYLLIKYGSTNTSNVCSDRESGAQVEVVLVDTFDFVTIQLYEGYSHAEYNTSVLGEAPESYLVRFARSVYAGWDLQIPNLYLRNQHIAVDSCTETEPLSNMEESKLSTIVRVSVAPNRLVIGLANGWAGDGKFLLIYPDKVKAAHLALQSEGLAPRGYAFWNIKDEGIASVRNPDIPVWMASGLNDFLHILK